MATKPEIRITKVKKESERGRIEFYRAALVHGESVVHEYDLLSNLQAAERHIQGLAAESKCRYGEVNPSIVYVDVDEPSSICQMSV